MVHMSFLAWHHLWRRFFSNLKFIVVDESHYYRGVIGSNMANRAQKAFAGGGILWSFPAVYLLFGNHRKPKRAYRNPDRKGS